MTLLSTKVGVHWNHKTKGYYIDKGYTFTNFGEVFEVLVEDLPICSTQKITACCDVCGKIVILQYQYYNKNIKKFNIYTCNSVCSKIKNKKTCKERYGYENFNNKDKYVETSLNKYGYDNPSKNSDVKTKKKNTNIKRFGYENVFQNEEIKEKIKNVLLDRYNVKHALQNKQLLDKYTTTLFENYGVKNPMLSEIVKEKQKNTCVKKYGNLFWYIVPRYNKTSLYFFKLIENITGLNIQHALKQNGEKKFDRYSVDGYIEKLNVVIEWDEKSHKNKDMVHKDIVRQNYIENKFKCKFFRIDQSKNIKDIYKEVYNLSDKLINLNKYGY